MCGIFGLLNSKKSTEKLRKPLRSLLNHRGPDGFGEWISPSQDIYLAHNRLSVIGMDSHSSQPMKSDSGNVLIFNGEIYNYKELKEKELSHYNFKSESDTEVILALYDRYGVDCIDHLRGMFSFALWDANKERLFCARDRFGIKPFYFVHSERSFVFASEMKALLPFIKNIETNYQPLSEYLTFQYTLGSETLFKDIRQLMPGHLLTWHQDHVTLKKYWDISYQIDTHISPDQVEEKVRYLLEESARYHQTSDVPIGSYLSGGIDSSLVTVLAAEKNEQFYGAFHGKFVDCPGYDESSYAQEVSNKINRNLYSASINANDFIDNIESIIYYLDTPVAGPGSFPQFMVSKLAARHVKVVIGGQGGDEIFGGYARYLIAYFEQVIKATIDGTYEHGSFVVTPQSIIPNLTLLQEYKPLIKEFWREGLFGPLDERYFRLIDRSMDMEEEIEWEIFDKNLLMERFKSIFNNQNNTREEAYFDKMTHFDFKCLLPALLHVEDRMSMAHGIESRVPFLDHPLVEFAATIPANIKFPGGKMKALLKSAFPEKIPPRVLNRRDKMGFPVPLKEWLDGPLKEFVYDIFSSQNAKTRGFYNPQIILNNLEKSSQFSRKIWGLLSLELWQRIFHDQQSVYHKMSEYSASDQYLAHSHMSNDL